MKFRELTPHSLRCIVGGCPAVIEIDGDKALIIGKKASYKNIAEIGTHRIGEGEVAIEIPIKLISEIDFSLRS